MKKYLVVMLLAFTLVLGACTPAKEEAKKEEVKVEEKAEETKDKAKEETKEEPKEETKEGEAVELTVSAAASLTDALNELKGMYETEHKNVKITYNFGASGTLQNQIEEGAKVDVFASAAQKQMKALIEKGKVDEADASDLLVNDVVLITTKKRDDLKIEKIEDVLNENVKTIALGEPGGVPVGQYSEEILNHLGILDEVKKKVSYGSDVRQVLSWVASGEADAGLVYKTDALIEGDNVNIVTSAPEGSHKPVVYPVSVLKESANREAALEFIEFLKSDSSIKVFEKYGFNKAK